TLRPHPLHRLRTGAVASVPRAPLNAFAEYRAHRAATEPRCATRREATAAPARTTQAPASSPEDAGAFSFQTHSPHLAAETPTFGTCVLHPPPTRLNSPTPARTREETPCPPHAPAS